MMAQYLSIKDRYKDALLFYRMGDFYEMFFDDAVLASDALNIALTKRGKHLGEDIPMCGVPFHAAENYLLSLIKKGFRVAVCEQLENPAEARKRGSKSVVKRDVVRLVTPGTLTEDSLLKGTENNYLSAYCEVRNEGAFAWADVSTGEFRVQNCSRAALSPLLARVAPREVLFSASNAAEILSVVEEFSAAPTPLDPGQFDSTGSRQRLCDLFNVASLDSFGAFDRAALGAMGALVGYVDITQNGKLPVLRPPEQVSQSSVMQIDAATLRNLEIRQNFAGGKAGSLLSVVDRSITGAGARLLAQRLTSPSTNFETIINRLNLIEYFVASEALRDAIRSTLRLVPDVDRSLNRLALDRGGPRDLAAIRAGIQQAHEIHSRLVEADPTDEAATLARRLTGLEDLSASLSAALVDEPTHLAREGGFVRTGFDDSLDQQRALRDQSKKLIADLQAEYCKTTGVNSLKVKYNNVLGYFVETQSSHANKMLQPPLSEDFIHRQTTANAVRFTTVTLSDLETRILNAASLALEIELSIFQRLVAQVLEVAADLGTLATALAEIDVATSLADLAASQNWCRPVVTTDRAFQIVDGRHPVVESALNRAGTVPFVPNDCDLTPIQTDAARGWLLTGPNMAGKSTFLRQNALIALLAQSGSYVPATEAKIGIVTQLFSRVGASDDLARGRSTFMVEMVETAAILNQAGNNALVILDEIGRGTATYDGLSIAWAALEYLMEKNRCRILFATHYHELTSLTSKLDGLSNATVSVKEWDGEIVFLHEVKEGAADQSYGIQVAKLAGLPDAVTNRARQVLGLLENSEQRGSGKLDALADDLPLFAVQPQRPIPKSGPSEIDQQVASLHPDEMSPRDALAMIYKLHALATENDS